jgi:mono/diheme cytochrome c family protein
MRGSILAAALAACVLAAGASAQAQAQVPPNPLPPGEGHDIVAVACTQCHGPNAFTQLREGAEGWRFQVYDMILRGAQLSPADIDPAVNYLATNFGPGINVPPPMMQVTLPDGPGKDFVASHCSVCHGLDRVASAKRPAAEWDRIIRRMIFLGAPVSDDEAKTVATYLDANFSTK